MEETVREVIYETRYHASRPYTTNYPPQHRNEDGEKSLISRLSFGGVSQLKNRWSKYMNPRKLTKSTSLFISPRAEHVAVAVGSQITFLQKDNDYQEPSGIFTSGSEVTFIGGSWSEAHDILGAIDDNDTVYFIKANGEEISRITSRDLKLSCTIIGLSAQDNFEVHRSLLCSFNVLFSDGSLQCIEVSHEPNVSTSSSGASNSSLPLKRQFPKNVICFDYHPESSLLGIIGSSISNSLTSNGSPGSFYLSFWRKSKDLSLEMVFSIQLEGLYVKPKGYMGQITCPKVLFSNQGMFVAILDLMGCLQICKVDNESCTLLRFGPKEDSNIRSDIADFTWWSDCILTVANRSGTVTMLDIPSCKMLVENSFTHSIPVLERVQQFQGHLFLLQSTADLHNVDQLNIAGSNWTLISFSERSITDMYKILISNQNYQAALDFANRHEMDKDEVLKSQWLKSDRGLSEINKYLSKIKDQVFVLSECTDKIGRTEDDVKALIAHGLFLTNQYKFSKLEVHDEYGQIWNFRMTRLQLLQFRDRLETYLGINMGRFSMQEYRKFRSKPINEVAVTLAESGKIGALNLLFKRHPYSLSPFMLEILAAVPETIPVQSYAQLLPGKSPPTNIVIRENDWVECKDMVSFIKSETHVNNTQIRTEPIVKQCSGYVWPSINQLSTWYRNRALDIDTLSGQLENCLCLIDFAYRKGILELQHFHEDISYLNELIYTNDTDGETSNNISLGEWVELSNYEKFRIILEGVKEDNVFQILCDKALPFMRNRSDVLNSDSESFLVKWLKEIASKNKLEICLVVIEEGCRDSLYNGIFKSEVEAVDYAIQCIYMSTVMDRWNIMASILSKLPQLQDTERCVEDLERRLKLAGGHIEAGRLLALYQVPKPISFFMEAHSDSKGVKQILRLILSKFSRRQPSRSDNDWANMWRDIQLLREKAFSFLDLEYMLMEFCRGLLKAGKFSLARNYLKGTGSVALASDKAEKLVIQAGREYFFSASSLACLEIWKAKECLNLFPNSRNVKAESDIIDVLTIRLPNLGVTLLPLQFRQIQDPMEIIKMAITTQPGAYLHVDELIEISKLLGLNSQHQISAVEELIAREAAVAGDMQLAFDLCIVLAKKGHGPIWDLCAAIARTPAIENIDISSRKQLLGFALSHCDHESIGELLHAWKDVDMQNQCETLLTSPSSSDILFLDSFDQENHFKKTKTVLLDVIKDLPAENDSDLDSFLRENGKISAFASLQLPQLLDLSRKPENDTKVISGNKFLNIRVQAMVTILSWLGRNGFAPKDNLVASLAKIIIEPPVTKEEDILGCSILLNLMDAFHGVEVIEEQLKTRQDYLDICSIMNVGMTYSLLHNSRDECADPTKRRELLLKMFKEKHTVLQSDDISRLGNAQSTFWREWKMKLEEKKHVTDQSRVLKQILPGVEATRFLSGDLDYIENIIFSLIDSIKFEKKFVLMDVMKLADTYGVHRSKVLQQYLSSILTSESWTEDEITSEISNVKGEIITCAAIVVKTIYLTVYPAVNGRNKPRLAYMYALLADCYSQSKETQELLSTICPEEEITSNLGLAQFYKVLEQESGCVSFIKDLDFKNISGLGGLNMECFNTEVFNHIDKDNLEALAKMVQNLAGMYMDHVPKGLISYQDVYKYYVMKLLNSLEDKSRTEIDIEKLLGLISQLEQTYDLCKKYIKIMEKSNALEIMKKFFTIIVPVNVYTESLPDTSASQDCLIMLLNFWIRLTEDMQDDKFDLDCFMRCLKVLIRVVTEDSISPKQGWGTIFGFLDHCFTSNAAADQVSIFCKSMVFSGCGFGAIADMYSSCTANTEENYGIIVDLPTLYLNILDTILQNLADNSSINPNLYRLLSSLSKLEGDLDVLKRVRHVIWEKMVKFSENLSIPSHTRVSALELMQYISGKNIKATELEKNLSPWEGWDELWCSTTSNVNGTNPNPEAPNSLDNNSSRFTSTLIALRSSQIIATVSPNLEITPDDLVDVGTAFSCFSKLCEASINEAHCEALMDILEEWESLFIIKTHEEEEASVKAVSDEESNWENNDWDDGWENFHEEQHDDVVRENKTESSSSSIHPLHSCWFELLKKLIVFSQFETVTKLIDKSLKNPNGILITESNLQILISTVLEMDSLSAVKIALLLPFESIQLQCLNAFEEKLKREEITDSIISNGFEFLILLFSSGEISTILTKSSYGTISSFLHYLIGKFSRECLEIQLSNLKNKDRITESDKNEEDLLFFRRILFPCFISELVIADQHILAGFLVTKFLHTNPSFSLINVAEAPLKRFLVKQLVVLQDDDFALDEMSFSGALKNTILSLRGKMGNLVETALSTLSNNVR